MPGRSYFTPFCGAHAAKSTLERFAFLLLFMAIARQAVGMDAWRVKMSSLHPCATCCINGPKNPACDFSFDGDEGVCCGEMENEFFCCPRFVNSTCASVFTGGSTSSVFQCIAPSPKRSGTFPLLVFGCTAILVIAGAFCMGTNVLNDSPLSNAIRKAEYQELCGHPEGYPSQFSSENPLQRLGGYQEVEEEGPEMSGRGRRGLRLPAAVEGLKEKVSEGVAGVADKMSGGLQDAKSLVASAVPDTIKTSLAETKSAIDSASKNVKETLTTMARAGIDDNSPEPLSATSERVN